MTEKSNVVVPFTGKPKPGGDQRQRAESTGALSARANLEAVLLAIGNAASQCSTSDVLDALAVLRSDRAGDQTAQAIATDAVSQILQDLAESRSKGEPVVTYNPQSPGDDIA